jgi:hypothetical protein
MSNNKTFAKALMKEQKTEMWLYHTDEYFKTGKVDIRRAILEGDSLSPLLFCLALIPLTNIQ